MLENNLDNELIHRSPFRARNMRARLSVSSGEDEHGLVNCPYFTGKWLGSSWKKAKDKYHKTPCACGNQSRTYCMCNKGVTMCLDCFNRHILNA